jgi:hypothetical protein
MAVRAAILTGNTSAIVQGCLPMFFLSNLCLSQNGGVGWMVAYSPNLGRLNIFAL